MSAGPRAPLEAARVEAVPNRWLRHARAVYLVALAALLAWVLANNRDQVAAMVREANPALLGLALLCSFLQLAASAGFWVAALAALGEPVGWRTTLVATARSVPARYAPGSVWYAVGRVALLRADGVGLRPLTVVATLESALTVVVSLALGSLLLLVAGRLPSAALTGVAWVVIAVVVASPPALNRLLRLLARWRGGAAQALSWQGYGRLLVWASGFWAVSATTFTLYLQAFPGPRPGVIAIAGTFLVAWAIGFLTPLAPQGAGAFELVFVTLLVGRPDEVLIVAVAAYRALIGIRDALAFGAAWIRS